MFLPQGFFFDGQVLVAMKTLLWFWRSGTARAANGAAVLPSAIVGRIDIGGAVEVEVVGLGAVRERGR